VSTLLNMQPFAELRVARRIPILFNDDGLPAGKIKIMNIVYNMIITQRAVFVNHVPMKSGHTHCNARILEARAELQPLF
jgi:hypothetical protein